MNSLVIPVYRNAESLPRLLGVLAGLHRDLGEDLEVVFVVDGSPDASAAILRERLPAQPYASRLVLLARNFGAFAAIRAGLEQAGGDRFAVMAADLQEPPELMQEFFRILASGEADVVVGTRRSRSDPWLSRMFSSAFWGLYRRFVIRDIPPGGVDVFACSGAFRNQLLALNESRSSLVGQLFWLGFRRSVVEYDRQSRQEGRSAWGFRRKLDYLLDSLYAFSDLPVRLLLGVGLASLLAGLAIAVVAVVARLSGYIDVPGYTPILVSVLLFGGFNALGLGIVGTYAWRAYENSKGRPLAVVMSASRFPGNPRGSP
ncbi:MAG: glycosyltransferase family 2 protein [Pseudoxanthomonas sp.]|nr:glycosyltransferase family 2 protein [Pseudoxanthomonas sp.]